MGKTTLNATSGEFLLQFSTCASLEAKHLSIVKIPCNISSALPSASRPQQGKIESSSIDLQQELQQEFTNNQEEITFFASPEDQETYLSMTDLGAEVVVENESMDESADRQVQEKFLYEEIVHTEDEEEMEDEVVESEDTVKKYLIILCQWTLSLREIAAEREASELQNTKCLCTKFEKVWGQARTLEDTFQKAVQRDEIRNLADSMTTLQDLLRSEVSIQISAPNLEIRGRAVDLVGQIFDVGIFVRDAIDSVQRSLEALLKCLRHQSDTSDEEEISNGVALMFTEDDEDEDEDKEKEIQRRKRKQNQVKSPPTSPTSSPTKRARRMRMRSAPQPMQQQQMEAETEDTPPILDLLESHRKGVRSNGLLQFVLWREAFKAEKDRIEKTEPRRLSYT